MLLSDLPVFTRQPPNYGLVLSDVGNGSGDDIKEGGSVPADVGAERNKTKMKMNAHFMKKLPKGGDCVE